jgi:general stress protein 26
MTKHHDQKEILTYLKEKSIGVLGTLDKTSDNIRLRVMYYGIDSKFNCYLMSTKGSPKIAQMLSPTDIAFIVYSLEEPFDKSWEIEIDGETELLKNPKDIDYALEKLKECNPFAEVAIESGITGQFDLIKLLPKVIRFRIYGEALQGEPPTVIQF